MRTLLQIYWPLVTSCLLLSPLLIQGCGKIDSLAQNHSRQEIKEKFTRSRKTPSTHPAFYQFADPIGSVPQRPFNPTYPPRSRSNRRVGITRESAGALLYATENQVIYVLVGLEQQNNFWNFMRGSVDSGESYVRGAVNEINQETGGVYEVTEEVLLSESFDVYHSRLARNYACTFFVKFDFIPAQKILKATMGHSDSHFREMTNYAWIRLDDLNRALEDDHSQFSARTHSGVTLTFNFYPYSFDILKQAFQKGILNHLAE